MLTLTTVRSAINARLPGYSFLGLAITSTQEDSTCPTIAIDREGILYYNQDFLQNNIKDDVDLFTVIMHEIFHVLYHHVFYSNDDISGIAMDAIINATLSTSGDFKVATLDGKFFRNYYKNANTIPNTLLKPGSKMEDSAYEAVYSAIYGNGTTSFDLINILRTTLPPETKSNKLLGNHTGGAGLDPVEISVEISTRVRGDGRKLTKLLKKVLEQHLSIRQALLKRFADKLALDNFTFDANTKRVFRSPVPIRPSRRDMTLLACGYDIVFWNNIVDVAQRSPKGLITVYLDVSGSVVGVLPKILGILKRHRQQISKMYTWSTMCVETDLDTLFKGEFQTSWGTDINCTMQHIEKNGVKKAIILTDGCFGSIYSSKHIELIKHIDLLTILFNLTDSVNDSYYKEHSEIVYLDNITE